MLLFVLSTCIVEGFARVKGTLVCARLMGGLQRRGPGCILVVLTGVAES
jgi:hypothetical protein